MNKIYIGEIGGYKYWLGGIVFKGLDWNHAKVACKSLGEGWELPSKEVMGMAWDNPYTRNILKSEGGRYWTSSEDSATYAWGQDSTTGNQYSNTKTYSTNRLVRPVYKEKVVDRSPSTEVKEDKPEYKIFYLRKFKPDGSVCNLSGITYMFSRKEGGYYDLHASVCRGDNFSKGVGKEVATESVPIFPNLSIGGKKGFKEFLAKHRLHTNVVSEYWYYGVEKVVLNLKRSALKGEPEYTLNLEFDELKYLITIVGNAHSIGLDLLPLYRKLKSLDQELARKIYRETNDLPLLDVGEHLKKVMYIKP